MAATPTFGDGAPVLEMNIGQLGSARQASGDAFYAANVNHGADETRKVQQDYPQQDFVTVEDMGFSGRRVQWTGNFRAKTLTIFQAVYSELLRYITGQTINLATGQRSSVDLEQMRPSKLVDAFGSVLSLNAKVLNVTWQNPRRRQDTGIVVSPLTIDFLILD